VANVDIKAAFASVDEEALWTALQAKHVPPFLSSLNKDLQIGTKSCSSWQEIGGLVHSIFMVLTRLYLGPLPVPYRH